MSKFWICEGIHSAISSRELDFGPSRLEERDGLTIGPSGPEVAPVNLSALQVSKEGSKTSGIFGPSGKGSSESLSLAWSLASRLQVLLASRGSMLYRLTWKNRVTPLGRVIYALRGSAPLISGSGFSGWPTARATDGEKNVRTQEGSLREIERKGSPQDLAQAAARRGGPALKTVAGWATPTANDSTGSEYQYDRPNLKGERAKILKLPGQAKLVLGPMLNGAPIGTGNIGRLNPAHSRWLQGIPATWDACAPTEIQLSRKSRKRS
jgi:hypothetical protein